MVGRSVSAPKARAKAPVIRKSLKSKAKKSEAELLKQLRKEEREAANYAKGQARRAEAAKAARVAFLAARAKAYDDIQAIQYALRSMRQHPFVYYPEVPIVFPDEIHVYCPACRHSLTEYEVMAGFRNDPLDFTTGCPKCKERFASVSVIETAQDKERFVWLCPPQTLEAYAEWLLRCQQQKQDPTFEWLCRSASQIAWNALRYGLEGSSLGDKNAETVVKQFLKMQ